MFAGTALSVRLFVCAGLSLFIICGPYLSVVVCVFYTYNLTIRDWHRDTNPGVYNNKVTSLFCWMTSTVSTSVWFTNGFPSLLLVDQYYEYLSMAYTGFTQCVAGWPALWVPQYGLPRISQYITGWAALWVHQYGLLRIFPSVLLVDQHCEYLSMVYTGFIHSVAGWSALWVPQYGLHRVSPECCWLTSTVSTSVWFTQGLSTVLLADQHCEYLSMVYTGFPNVLLVEQHCEYLSMVYTGFPLCVAGWPALWVPKYDLHRVYTVYSWLTSTVSTSVWFSQGLYSVLLVDQQFEYLSMVYTWFSRGCRDGRPLLDGHGAPVWQRDHESPQHEIES